MPNLRDAGRCRPSLDRTHQARRQGSGRGWPRPGRRRPATRRRNETKRHREIRCEVEPPSAAPRYFCEQFRLGCAGEQLARTAKREAKSVCGGLGGQQGAHRDQRNKPRKRCAHDIRCESPQFHGDGRSPWQPGDRRRVRLRWQATAGSGGVISSDSVARQRKALAPPTRQGRAETVRPNPRRMSGKASHGPTPPSRRAKLWQRPMAPSNLGDPIGMSRREGKPVAPVRTCAGPERCEPGGEIRELVAVARATGSGGEGEPAAPGKYVDLVNLSALELQCPCVPAPGRTLNPAHCDRTGGNSRVEADDSNRCGLQRQRQSLG